MLDSADGKLTSLDPASGERLNSAYLDLTRPVAMAKDHAGRGLWVADAGGSVALYDLSGTAIVSLDAPGWPFVAPSGVAVDADGTVYVADSGLNRVFAFGADGGLRWSVGGHGYEVGHFQGTGGVTVDVDRGYIYIADPGNRRVDIFDREGYPVSQFPRGSQAPVNLEHPVGVALDGDGAMFIVDSAANRLVKMNVNGNFVGAAVGSPGWVSPSAIAFTSDGQWWIADPAAHQVFRLHAPLTTGGEVTAARAFDGGAKRPKRKFVPEGKYIIAAPNPAHDRARFGVWLDEPAKVRVSLVNLAAEMVQTIDLGEQPEGEIVRDLDLTKCAPGIYFLVYQIDEGHGMHPKETFKMAIIR